MSAPSLGVHSLVQQRFLMAGQWARVGATWAVCAQVGFVKSAEAARLSGGLLERIEVCSAPGLWNGEED